MSLIASGLPIDGESLLRFKKHHAPVTFEATQAAVVLDTLSFRKIALAVLGIAGSCALAAATASVLGLSATRRETIDTYDCKALTAGPWQDRATREQPCRGADGRTESLASGAVVEMGQSFDHRFHHSFVLYAIVVPRNDHGRPAHGEWMLTTETSLHGRGAERQWQLLSMSALVEWRVTCTPGEARCAPLALARSVENLYEQYTAEVRLVNPPKWLASVELEWVRTDPYFAPLLSGLKGALLLLTAAAAVLYHARMPAAPSFEQRCVGLLCATLPLIDDPSAATIALVPARMAALSSSLSVLSGWCCLLLFWLVQVDALGAPPSREVRWHFYPPKAALVLSLWAVRSLERCLRLVHTWSSPLLPEGPLAAELQLVGAGLAAMYCVWLAYLLLRMARRLHLLDARSRVTYYLSGATACVTLSGLTAAELSPGEQGVPSLFAGLVLVNLYGLALACFYMPTSTCPSACREEGGALRRAGQGGMLVHSKTATPFCHDHLPSRCREQVAVVSDHSSSC